MVRKNLYTFNLVQLLSTGRLQILFYINFCGPRISELLNILYLCNEVKFHK